MNLRCNIMYKHQCEFLLSFLFFKIFIQDSLFNSQGELLSMRVDVLMRLIPHLDTGVVHTTVVLPTRQPPLWFIDITLKLWCSAEYIDYHFSSFCVTRL